MMRLNTMLEMFTYSTVEWCNYIVLGLIVLSVGLIFGVIVWYNRYYYIPLWFIFWYYSWQLFLIFRVIFTHMSLDEIDLEQFILFFKNGESSKTGATLNSDNSNLGTGGGSDNDDDDEDALCDCDHQGGSHNNTSCTHNQFVLFGAGRENDFACCACGLDNPNQHCANTECSCSYHTNCINTPYEIVDDFNDINDNNNDQNDIPENNANNGSNDKGKGKAKKN